MTGFESCEVDEYDFTEPYRIGGCSLTMIVT